MSNTPGTPGLKIELDVRDYDGREWVTFRAYEELRNQVTALNLDNAQLRKNHAMTDGEMLDIARVRKDNEDNKTIIDDITVFIREHYAYEISLGQHNAFKSIADAVCFYLGKERQHNEEKRKARAGWLERIFGGAGGGE